MSAGALVFAPLVAWPLIGALAVLVLLIGALALWRGLRGAALRLLGGALLVAALTGPAWEREGRDLLPDIALMLVDESASNRLAERADTTRRAAAQLAEAITARPGIELRQVAVSDAAGDGGTQLIAALNDALEEIPRGQLAGVIALSDGQVHDAGALPDLPAPVHLLHTGRASDWDRRLVVTGAPGYAILGEEIVLSLRVEDIGAAPSGARTLLSISIDGAPAQTVQVRVGRQFRLPLTLPHAGLNVIRFAVPEAEGELTARNNAALVQINGVRDRLRVLLVSGAPHQGARTWRNLLKSDSAVDLVHFTILRPADKHDGVPVDEVSLIAFPTRELFMDKIEEFDLIIFDRYKRRGILPPEYLANVARYVRGGGAVLVAAGPDFAGVDSLALSPLADVLPARPTARVMETAFRPERTALGARHPVTAGLPAPESWGRWLRQIGIAPSGGEVLLTGAEGAPLLVLTRRDEGRVALLASDQAWLWDRGYDGGGPQQELLRRLAHWLMKEPDLEEEALWATATGQTMQIVRRTLAEEAPDVVVTAPDGAEKTLSLAQVAPGRFEARWEGPELGLFRLRSGTQEAVVGLGPAAPREFEAPLATTEVLAPLVAARRGGALALADGVPQVRRVAEGRAAAGRGWIGLTPRGAYDTTQLTRIPLLPAWLALVLIAGAILGAWLREGRRT